MSLTNGLYRHLNSGKVYKVIGVGRRVEVPHKQVLIYENFYDHASYDIDTCKGQLWVRDVDDDLQLIKINQKIIR